MAAVGVAGAARKVAAGHVDLDLMAGAERVTDVAEVDRQPLHAIRRKLVRLARRVCRRRVPALQQHVRPVLGGP
jgi:hypothetical protein